MADFCKQCSLDIFGIDFVELANITPEADFKEGYAASVLCEGCGAIRVDPDGKCLSNCLKNHSLM